MVSLLYWPSSNEPLPVTIEMLWPIYKIQGVYFSDQKYTHKVHKQVSALLK